MNETQENIVRKRRQLSPEEKYQIFIEATMAKAKGNGSIAEVLRRWGIHATDLTRIRKAVEDGAISTFQSSKEPKAEGGLR